MRDAIQAETSLGSMVAKSKKGQLLVKIRSDRHFLIVDLLRKHDVPLGCPIRDRDLFLQDGSRQRPVLGSPRQPARGGDRRRVHAQSRARAHVQRREGASQHEHYKIAKQAGWESTILDELKALAEYWIFDFREIRTPAAPPASRGGARRQPRRPHVPFGWMEMAGLPLAGLAALLLRERASSLRTSTASRDGCARW